MERKIALLSTFAEDKIKDETGKIIKVQKGGPAFYISNVFKKEKVSFDLIKSPIAVVEILSKKGGEIGKVVDIFKPQKIFFGKMKNSFLVISGIYKDFDLRGISKFSGKVFLDVQGYTRVIKKFNVKKRWKPTRETMDSFFCLKGTAKEIKHLPASFIKKQKQKILIITKGKSGCEIFVFGKRYIIKPKKVVKPINTIGAGDVFFAYLISEFLITKNIIKSAKYAVNKTSQFLYDK